MPTHFNCQCRCFEHSTGRFTAVSQREARRSSGESNRRRLLVILFNFAKAQGWLRANEETAADALGTYKIKRRDVEIYTPAEIARLLGAADMDFVPYLALIAFGGVRREELHKGLMWEAINFDRGDIIVPAAIAKTDRKRKIVMY